MKLFFARVVAGFPFGDGHTDRFDAIGEKPRIDRVVITRAIFDDCGGVMRKSQVSEAAVLRVADVVMADEAFLVEEYECDCGIGGFRDTVELRSCAGVALVFRIVCGGAVFLADDGLHRRDGDQQAFAFFGWPLWCRFKQGADALPFGLGIGELRELATTEGAAGLEVFNFWFFQAEVTEIQLWGTRACTTCDE